MKNGPDFYYDPTDGFWNVSDPYRPSENGHGWPESGHGCYLSNGYGCGFSNGSGYSNGWKLGLERSYDYDSPYENDPDLHFGYDDDEPA